MFHELKSVNWDRMANLTYRLNRSLNDPSLRFSKEKYINFGIQQVTNNLLEYVDGDGYDFIFNHSNIQHCRIETKSSANMFEFERKKRKGNAATASAVLKNNRGNGYDWLR